MSHYAKVCDGRVVNVIVAEAEFFDTFKDTSPGTWIQTSYNTRGGVHYDDKGQPDGGIPLRGNFAGIGYSYDVTKDLFYPPSPFPSWVLNEKTLMWDAPVAIPDDGKRYSWDESTKSWVAMG